MQESLAHGASCFLLDPEKPYAKSEGYAACVGGLRSLFGIFNMQPARGGSPEAGGKHGATAAKQAPRVPDRAALGCSPL